MSIDFWDPAPAAVTARGQVVLFGEGPTFCLNPWDTAYIGGLQVPGKCGVKGLPTLSFDRKKSAGADGAVITVHGYIPGDLILETLLWTQAQWDAFQILAPVIWTKPNKTTKAKDIARSLSHPGFALWGITSGVVLGVGVPEDGNVVGTKVIRIKLGEFVPTSTKNRTKTVKANVPLDSRFVPTTGGAPPSKTDIGPRGP